LVFNSHIEKCSKSLEKPKICSPNPCMNGAKCIDMPDSKYKCQCRNGFTGNHCENKDVCPPKACGTTGACLSIGFNSPISHLCWCDNGQSFGLDCNKSLETNPCNSIGSKNKKFALKLNPSVYVLCDETKPQIKFCQYPLVFSETTNDCDWAEYRK
jgi:Notch-like protein